jgi:hypothetical protein
VHSHHWQVREEPAGYGMRPLARLVFALLWGMVRLPVSALLRILEPVVRFSCSLIAVSGILISVMLELSGSAPNFPFWGALAFFTGCGVIPVMFRIASRIFAR